jgi:hypothetical protein
MAFKPLSETHPLLVKQWDHKRNDSLKPSDLGIGSKALVWWTCDKGHYWQQAIFTRRNTHACSFCLNQKVWAGENDLATTNPPLAAEWHPTKNGSTLPIHIIAGSAKKFWWQCDKGHEWLASVGMRNTGVGCGVCANRVVMTGVNDLAHLEPSVAAEWHPRKNGALQPSQIGVGSNTSVWWLCGNGHEWKAPPTRRCFGKRSGCAICANQMVLKGFNDLATTTPELAKMWHPTKNGSLSAQDVVAGSSLKHWWICSLGHSFRSTGSQLVQGRGCGVCTGAQIELGVNDLQSQDPTLATEWDMAKNKLTPDQVTLGSNKKVWWLCKNGHSFEAAISHRGNRGTGCPYCANKKVLKGFNDLASTYPAIAKQWHPTRNLPITPQDVIAGTAVKYWWQCDDGHPYHLSGDKITRGIGCSVCSNYTIIVGVNDLAHTNPEIATSWHPTKNGDLKPTEMVAGSHKKIWWFCDKEHVWQASAVNRLNGNNCPSCSMGGFDPNQPSRLYFISNNALASRKVGITNFDSGRLSGFTKFGWSQIKVWEFDNGFQARQVEKEFFSWLRTEIKLAPMLDSKDMGKLGGWTETFSDLGISNDEIIEKVNSLLASIIVT